MAKCSRFGPLCNLVKPGIGDVQAERVVAVTPDGGRIAVIAMKETPLEPSRKAVMEAARRAGKRR